MNIFQPPADKELSKWENNIDVQSFVAEIRKLRVKLDDLQRFADRSWHILNAVSNAASKGEYRQAGYRIANKLLDLIRP